MEEKNKTPDRDNPKEKTAGKPTGSEGKRTARTSEQGGTIPKEFFNPKSMLTPGLCGGVTMLITNALASQFNAPPNYTGLIVSCLFGLIVFAATATVFWLRVVFWALNSLVIFSIALGSNQIGVQQTSKRKETTSLLLNLPLIFSSEKPKNAFFANWLDGTIHKRDVLVNDVRGLNAQIAQRTLTELGINTSHLNSTGLPTNWPIIYLEKVVRSAPTAESIGRFRTAVATAGIKG